MIDRTIQRSSSQFSAQLYRNMRRVNRCGWQAIGLHLSCHTQENRSNQNGMISEDMVNEIQKPMFEISAGHQSKLTNATIQRIFQNRRRESNHQNFGQAKQ
jgi:hypothetical protein